MTQPIKAKLTDSGIEIDLNKTQQRQLTESLSIFRRMTEFPKSGVSTEFLKQFTELVLAYCVDEKGESK